MKKNNKKKLFITLSSGILLSLATNQDVIYASETEQPEIINNIELVDNAIIIEYITAYSMEGENKVEVKDLIEQITITQIDEKTYKVSGSTLENSEVILVIDDTEKFTGVSDENGNFEIEIKELLEASSLKAVVKDNQDNTYSVEFTLADFIQQLEIIEQPIHDDLSGAEKPTPEESMLEEAPSEVPSEEEEATLVEEAPTEVLSEEEESTPVEEAPTEVPSEEEEATP
ncbi:MAG: Ig-like domain-containing protein, partial [Carnobacterium sp.]|uniref:Ig-like domain-containing protein n=1 Tax=Carnobacterium sp. TaxID=48221 RepID=UPI003315F769